jgi:NAD(P)H-dependent FMN reductase
MRRRKKVLALSTTTHDPKVSTSVAMATAALHRMGDEEVCFLDTNKLHIVENLSCYASGKRNCANPEAGPYRCWAHVNSVQDPEKYGGVDEMPLIYDKLRWADVVIFCTSTRWGSHSALLQKIIERMNTLENQGATWGEPYPMAGKRCGVVVGGLHWKTQRVADQLQETFRWFRFDVPQEHGALVWQRTDDVFFEQPGSNKPFVEAWLDSAAGQRRLGAFVDTMLSK